MDVEEQEISTLDIDLGVARRGELNEDYLGQFGAAVGMVMKAITQGYKVPLSVRGTASEIRSFADVLSKEKGYMLSFNNHGLNDKRTYSSKYKLDKAVKDFEKSTGLKWPFK
tara:strand:- start:748 stop:1083 length:336 start_codon:yes stop_codon:yes gene_type:complete